MTDRISERRLNRATLARQLLLRREALSVADGVRRVVALQAQAPPSPYLALWNRLRDFDPAELDGAFADQSVVKATLMRATLHAVHGGDYRAFREGMEPTLRGARLHDRRFQVTGLTVADAQALLPGLLAYAERPRAGAALGAWLEERAGKPLPASAWRMLRQYAPLQHAPTGGPWSFSSSASFVAARSLPALADPDAAEAALETLILRYLAGFGPASAMDIAQFGMIQRGRVSAALSRLAGKIERCSGPNGEALFDIPGAPLPDEDTPAPPRLLGMWDSVLLAHRDRSRVLPEAYRRVVIRTNGDVLPTLLVDGSVAGVWRAVEHGIEATAFHPLSNDAWHALAIEAGALRPFLAARDPQPYRRYDHWWDKLPGGETRLLPEDESQRRASWERGHPVCQM